MTNVTCGWSPKYSKIGSWTWRRRNSSYQESTPFSAGAIVRPTNLHIYIYIIGFVIFFHCQLTCFNEMQKILLSRIFIMRSMMMKVSWRMIIIGKSSSKRWMQLDHTAWHVGSPKPYPKQIHQRKRICGRISRFLRKTSKFLSICVPLPSLTNCS